MNSGRKQEQGFTLIEVLAAIVILSIVSLVLTSYFTNALSYSKSNQNKTIMVNLARNALFYMEKQDFEQMQELFKDHTKIVASSCKPGASCSYAKYFPTSLIVNSSSTSALPNVLNPRVNNIDYEVNIIFQTEIKNSMKSGTVEGSVNQGIGDMKKDMEPFLLPVQVEVTGPGGPKASTYTAVVEGYITDEKIR